MSSIVCTNPQYKATVYDLRSHNIDKLRYFLGTYDWSGIFASFDVNFVYDAFLSAVRSLISLCIPQRQVRMGTRDPAYITPLVKSLLVKRNKLRRSGRTVEANQLAARINQLIVECQSKSLGNLTDATPKQMWAAVKPSRRNGASRPPLDVDSVNSFLLRLLLILTMILIVFYSINVILDLAKDSRLNSILHVMRLRDCYVLRSALLLVMICCLVGFSVLVHLN